MKRPNKKYKQLIFLYLNFLLILFLSLTAFSSKANHIDHLKGLASAKYGAELRNDPIRLELSNYFTQYLTMQDEHIKVDKNIFFTKAMNELKEEKTTVDLININRTVQSSTWSKHINYQKYTQISNELSSNYFIDRYRQHLPPSIRFNLFN